MSRPDQIATARRNLEQAKAWTPRDDFDRQAKANTIAQIEAWLAQHERVGRAGHPAGGGTA